MGTEERRPLIPDESGSPSAHPYHHSHSQDSANRSLNERLEVVFDQSYASELQTASVYGTENSLDIRSGSGRLPEVIPQEVFRVTPARWYILFAFCFMGTTQGFIGNSWSPISPVMRAQFGWTDSTVSQLAMYLSLLFIPGALMFPSVMAISNMRVVVLGNGLLMALTGALKILSATVMKDCWDTCLIPTAHVTQIVNGFCGAVPFSGVMYVTVNWFPTSERIVATGVVMSSLNVGLALPFLLGTALVPEPKHNGTVPEVFPFRSFHYLSDSEDHDQDFYNQRLTYYLVIQGVTSIMVFIFVLIYFPSRPKYAPTASAVTARLSLTEGIGVLMRKGNFWMVVIIYACTSGVFNGYSLMLEPILSKSGIDQSTAGKIGFVGLLASVPANILIGALGSAFSRYEKIMNVAILSVGTACFAIFVAILQGWIADPHQILLYVFVISGIVCITGVVPLLFDMSADSSHPVSEELSSTVMVLGNQMMCNIFLILMAIKNLLSDDDKQKLNYVLVVSFLVAIFLSCCWRRPFNRLDLDTHSITYEQLDTRSIQQIRNAEIENSRSGFPRI